MMESEITTPEEHLPVDIEPTTVSLLAIFKLFFQIGLLSFGGGLSAWVYREVVETHHWLTDKDLLSGLALSQVMPGINVANLSIYVGQRLRGIPGAITALVALLFAPFFIIIGFAAVYSQVNAIPWVHNFLSGVAAAAVGLVMSVVFKAAKSTRRIGPLAILAFILLTVGILRWPMIPIVIIISPISVFLAWRTKGGADAR